MGEDLEDSEDLETLENLFNDFLTGESSTLEFNATDDFVFDDDDFESDNITLVSNIEDGGNSVSILSNSTSPAMKNTSTTSNNGGVEILAPKENNETKLVKDRPWLPFEFPRKRKPLLTGKFPLGILEAEKDRKDHHVVESSTPVEDMTMFSPDDSTDATNPRRSATGTEGDRRRFLRNAR